MGSSGEGEAATPDWSRGPGGATLRLGLATFAILALELAIIRWMSGQIRIVAYFQNFVLLAAFFGMGLGVALGRKHPKLFHHTLPLLAVLSVVLAFAPELKLTQLTFPDPSISLWGGDAKFSIVPFLAASVLVTVFFWFVAGVFLLAGIPVGWLFHQMPPLRAYSVDIAGSLIGVIAMTIAAAMGTSPVVWMIIGCVPVVFLSGRVTTLVAAIVIIVMAYVSVGGAKYSPYNRIDVVPFTEMKRTDEWRLKVNRDFHQDMLNLSDKAIKGPDGRNRAMIRAVYELPFATRGNGKRALIVGAGTGNDVMAALRRNYQEVYSVEIDREIMNFGKKYHPEQPYSDPRVVPIVNDARAYFEQNPNEKFDVVAYGLLDSHAMFSAMSSLRLDNYVYTVEGIRAGWKHVKEDGVLSIAFSVALARDWMPQRLWATIAKATGHEPVMIAHGYHGSVTYLVGRTLHPDQVAWHPRQKVTQLKIDPTIDLPTDDWPFLYLKPGTIPWAYLAVLLLVLATCGGAARLVYGKGLFSSDRFSPGLFCLGAGFMLLETRGVTSLSLLFGSTWVVNASVFASILMVILIANSGVERRAPKKLHLWFGLLFASLLLTYMVDPGMLNKYDLMWRGILGGLLFAVPIGFASVIFASLLKAAPDSSGALGSNLMGAMVGGVAEYSSMLLGLKAMALLALVFYLLAMLAVSKRNQLSV